jgi:hypothetical protein
VFERLVSIRKFLRLVLLCGKKLHQGLDGSMDQRWHLFHRNRKSQLVVVVVMIPKSILGWQRNHLES